MNRMISCAAIAAICFSALTLAGCGSNNPTATKGPKVAKADTKGDVADERAKLSAEDRLLVDAQEWCVVSTDERLGSMGPPVKLTIKGQPVFLCCKGCQKKAEADPDKTIAKLEELKAKKKQQGG